MKLSFHGAVDGVTGSCHLVETGGLRLLVDCGLFQGENQWRARNEGEFGFDPKDIDYLLLTHAHLDHCGRIPLLVKRGFRGRIICTPATADIAKVVLLDSAQVQEEDFWHWRLVNRRQGYEPKKPLYGTMDVLDSLGYFSDEGKYDKTLKLGDRVKVTFRDAGHILGAAFIEIESDDMRVVFSGDLGNTRKPIIRDPVYAKQADVVVVETTYADRGHRPIADSVEELLQVIAETFERGGNVVIPSFAVERAQELLFFLRQLHDEKRLPKASVFLDSPMGISVTNIMRRHPECFDEQTLGIFNAQKDPFMFQGVSFTKTQSASKLINSIKSGAIIIAGAGMCNGGRIRLHFRYNIWRPECSIVFIGFQAEGTLGRKLVDGAEMVDVLGENYRVKAKIHTIGGFSSHADRDILLDWLGHNKDLKKVFLIHGEAKSRGAFKGTLAGTDIAQETITPELNRVYEL
jgi:metallo-beta-lactamase family protein